MSKKRKKNPFKTRWLAALINKFIANVPLILNNQIRKQTYTMKTCKLIHKPLTGTKHFKVLQWACCYDNSTDLHRMESFL